LYLWYEHQTEIDLHSLQALFQIIVKCIVFTCLKITFKKLKPVRHGQTILELRGVTKVYGAHFAVFFFNII